ncbi:DUF3857 domain-containing protein [Flagellimonas flava]|uniref:DUF3857 domain-containing protein n=1 Tax=Flagellimonas flava TaxID=570519 RepID=UPI003D645CCD
MRILTFLLAFLSFYISFTQESDLSMSSINQDLLEGSNAVVRNHQMHVRLISLKDMEVDYERTITVLNENGNIHTNLFVSYNNGIHVKNAYAEVYDKSGELIKKIKKKDFLDVSAVDGGTLYSDSRVLYTGYLPVEYPYTIKFQYQIKTGNTGTVPSWSFVDNFLVSTETSNYTIEYADAALKPNILEKNLDNFPVNVSKLENGISYEAKNIKAFKDESLRPSGHKIFPQLVVSPINFHYEGYNAFINNWTDLGNWMNNNLLKDQDELDPSTIAKIKNLVKGSDNVLERAKKVYEYVQQNTRYISVQIGIGGLKPISAIEVDRLKYGDCKGLANYTKALLSAAGVRSYYVHVEAGSEKVDFESDVASLSQGNHVILAIPYDGNYYWIDCTSQVHPFGFLGDFTDDRTVLVMKPDGGEIARTVSYINEENLQRTTGYIQLNEQGDFYGNVQIETKGIQYDQHFGLQQSTKTDIEKYYKHYWSNIDNLTIEQFEFNNDKEKVTFKEKVILNSVKYASRSDNRLVFVANALNNPQNVPRRYRNRKFPLEISRGYLDEDEFKISIPENYKIESLPNSIDLETKFGSYSLGFESVGDQILVKRRILIKKGTYLSSDYNEYRSFKRNVSKMDNSKIVIIKKS